MSFTHFLRKSKQVLEKRGVKGVPAVLGDFSLSAISRVPVVGQLGTSVYEHEWDTLVVLDACRVDMYQEVVGDCDSLWSVGSASPEWMANTFSGRDMSDTAYITGNPFSRDLDETDFGLLDEVWRYAWDDEQGTIPPKPLTDRGIRVSRLDKYERVIIHYMQPHYPFIGGEGNFGHIEREEFGVDGVLNEDDVWTQVRVGDITDINQLKRAYWDNLDYVFQNIETLLENVDGRVVITADHGNALGEFGLWGHPRGIQLPVLRRVPWDIRDCTDASTYEPDHYDREQDITSEAIKQRLSELGYT